METLKHLLGLCGESHFNLITFFVILLIFKITKNLIYKYEKQ
jgi:hypothetical protein